jgi:hypothetical protein
MYFVPFSILPDDDDPDCMGDVLNTLAGTRDSYKAPRTRKRKVRR